jgi:octaprenyl-diphosphate synthase
LEGLLDTIEEMIFAESLQLEMRGRISTDRQTYFRIVEGKTASVFRWAMAAGAVAGGLEGEQREALETFGVHLGVAFQATDDLLDLTGDAAATGKELFTDLREGKMTFPVIVALERDRELRPIIESIVAQPVEEAVTEEAASRVVASLRATRAVEDCLALARERSGLAIECLRCLPENRAVLALATVAQSITDRQV